MNSKAELYKKIAYGVLTVLFICIIFSCFTYQHRVVQNLSFRGKTNRNSNQEGYINREGFEGNKKDKGDVNLLNNIKKKINGLIGELGGSAGVKETKLILKELNKVINLKNAKYITDMIEENSTGNSINIESLLNNDSMHTEFKKYSDLSNAIQDMLKNI